MPYPRRIQIFLRERDVPTSVVTVVPVSDPGNGDKAADGFPPRPDGSLPILAIPAPDAAADRSGIPRSLEGWTLLRQSLPIMQYLDQTIVETSSVEDVDPYVAACNTGYSISAETVMTSWNTPRLFASGVGPLKISEAAKEGLKWVHRELAAVEKHLGEDGYEGGFGRRLSLKDSDLGPSTGDILLQSFLELVDDLYGCFDELTLGKGTGRDAYGREIENARHYPHIREFYQLFRERPSARRDAGEGKVVSPALRNKASQWVEDVFDS